MRPHSHPLSGSQMQLAEDACHTGSGRFYGVYLVKQAIQAGSASPSSISYTVWHAQPLHPGLCQHSAALRSSQKELRWFPIPCLQFWAIWSATWGLPFKCSNSRVSRQRAAFSNDNLLPHRSHTKLLGQIQHPHSLSFLCMPIRKRITLQNCSAAAYVTPTNVQRPAAFCYFPGLCSTMLLWCRLDPVNCKVTTKRQLCAESCRLAPGQPSPEAPTAWRATPSTLQRQGSFSMG